MWNHRQPTPTDVDGNAPTLQQIHNTMQELLRNNEQIKKQARNCKLRWNVKERSFTLYLCTLKFNYDEIVVYKMWSKGVLKNGPSNGVSLKWPPNGVSLNGSPYGAYLNWPPNGASLNGLPNGVFLKWT